MCRSFLLSSYSSIILLVKLPPVSPPKEPIIYISDRLIQGSGLMPLANKRFEGTAAPYQLGQQFNKGFKKRKEKKNTEGDERSPQVSRFWQDHVK